MTAEQLEALLHRLETVEYELKVLHKIVAQLQEDTTNLDHRTTGMIRLGGSNY